MSKFIVHDNYGNRPSVVKSVNDGVLKTVCAGYRSVAAEIESMVISGEVFNHARESFDYPDGDISEVKHVDTYDMDDFDKADLAKKIRKDIGQAIEARKSKERADEIAAIKAEALREFKESQGAPAPETPSKEA